MTSGKSTAPFEATVERALKELTEADITRQNSDAKRILFVKIYKQFDAFQRQAVCELAAALLKDKFAEGARLESIVHLLASSFASERDWHSARHFLLALVESSSDAEFYRELSLLLLEITDNELSEKGTKHSLAQTTLVLLTELGLLLAAREGQSALDHRDIGRVVEYITTNLLARSNINNNAMRISLVHYLSRCPLSNQGTNQLNRVISRFGQSLLDDMLQAFFEDKRKGNAAFYFLVEHLNSFFSATPALAEMSHNVLKHYMLKFPNEFPLFLASYSEWMRREDAALKLAATHISLLFRAAVDVSQRQLAENIGKILIKHLTVFRDVSKDLLSEQVQLAVQIVANGPQIKGQRSPAIEDFLKEAKTLLDQSAAHDSSKVLPLSKVRKSKDPQIKFAKIGEKPSPLESMLQLAS